MMNLSTSTLLGGGVSNVPLVPSTKASQSISESNRPEPVESLSVNDQLAEHFLGVLPIRPNEKIRPDYASAFRAWDNCLGAEHVCVDDSTRDDYAKTTLPMGTRPAGVVRPHTVDEVQEVVRIARTYCVPLHAISRGRNWGYGDACAPEDGYVIVDLRRMNRIREVNVELGYAVIEPGVSQGQLYEYIRDNNLPLILDVTGAGPDASIVGNILQRGFGHTPYGDRFRNTSGFEVVLPDGRIVHTGFGKFENSRAAHVFPWGSGPWCDGLFTQSNYGIVTTACIWLMPRPQVIKGFAFTFANEMLSPIIDTIRQLRMGGTIRSTIHIANDLRVLSTRLNCPWKQAQRKNSLSQDIRCQLRRDHGIGEWNAIGGIYGTAQETHAAIKTIREAIGPYARIHIVTWKKLDRARYLGRLLQRWRIGRQLLSTVKSASAVFELLNGIPNAEHIAGIHWRSSDGLRNGSIDPRAAGLIWLSPIVPMTVHAVQQVLGLIDVVMKRYSFDPLLTLASINERSLCVVISICYDNTDSREAAAAASCYVELSQMLSEHGYYAYREAKPHPGNASVSQPLSCNSLGQNGEIAN